MAFNTTQTIDIIEIMEQYLERNRPPQEIRSQLDIGYRIDNQSVIIFEIRPDWFDSSKIMEHDQAKTTYIKSRNRWKVFWLRSSGWYPYKPAEMKNLQAFVKEIEADPHGCFWG